MKTPTQKNIFASMPAALACVAAKVIKIPSPLNGYINPGDCIVLLSDWLFPRYMALWLQYRCWG